MALVYLPASFLIISGFVSFFSYVFSSKFCFIAFLSRFVSFCLVSLLCRSCFFCFLFFVSPPGGGLLSPLAPSPVPSSPPWEKRWAFLIDVAVALKCFGVATSYLVVVGCV